MKKTIEELSEQDLQKKIENIKAEHEKTANALKRYEEELERRKNKNWLPLNEEISFTTNQLTLDTSCIEIKVLEGFRNKDSFYKYLSALKTIRKAWFANSKGEPIDIEVLLPLLKKGWVAMDKDGTWYFFTNKPYVNLKAMDWRSNDIEFWKIRLFNLKPATDWQNSLMECGI